VNGAGSVTGGAEVLASAGPFSHERVRALGASHVVDYHDEHWPDRVRALTGGSGVSVAVNAAPGGAADAIRAVADGGPFGNHHLRPTCARARDRRIERLCEARR
jgi:NADPH:quinone reductase-like Zn-dependent oxidoreductase